MKICCVALLCVAAVLLIAALARRPAAEPDAFWTPRVSVQRQVRRVSAAGRGVPDPYWGYANMPPVLCDRMHAGGRTPHGGQNPSGGGSVDHREMPFDYYGRLPGYFPE